MHSTHSQLKQMETVLPKLRTIIANLLKADPEEINVDAPFLEMGADSIVLVDAILKIENAFGIKISIRQLFEELTTLSALASYIEQNTIPQPQAVVNTPQQPAIQPLTAPTIAPLNLSNNTNSSLMESIIRQQMQIMSQQLELLRGFTTTLHQ